MYEKFQEYVPLAGYTTLGIGGKSRYFVKVSSIEEMQKIVLFCLQERLSYRVLGKGSNVLLEDALFSGLTILNKIDFFEQMGSHVFSVGAGYSFTMLGKKTVTLGFSGLEFAGGIPGSCGGAVFMNAGANGHETKDALRSVSYVDQNGTLTHVEKEGISFGYRYSAFQKMPGVIIVSALFQLTQSDTAKEFQKKILSSRYASQPYEERSAGCAFRNPPNMSAGKLIEECGLKGFQIGDAAVSFKHANFFVNKGNASFEDMYLLLEEVRKRVADQMGIVLEDEIRYMRSED